MYRLVGDSSLEWLIWGLKSVGKGSYLGGIDMNTNKIAKQVILERLVKEAPRHSMSAMHTKLIYREPALLINNGYYSYHVCVEQVEQVEHQDPSLSCVKYTSRRPNVKYHIKDVNSSLVTISPLVFTTIKHMNSIQSNYWYED